MRELRAIHGVSSTKLDEWLIYFIYKGAWWNKMLKQLTFDRWCFVTCVWAGTGWRTHSNHAARSTWIFKLVDRCFTSQFRHIISMSSRKRSWANYISYDYDTHFEMCWMISIRFHRWLTAISSNAWVIYFFSREIINTGGVNSSAHGILHWAGIFFKNVSVFFVFTMMEYSEWSEGHVTSASGWHRHVEWLSVTLNYTTQKRLALWKWNIHAVISSAGLAFHSEPISYIINGDNVYCITIEISRLINIGIYNRNTKGRNHYPPPEFIPTDRKDIFFALSNVMTNEMWITKCWLLYTYDYTDIHDGNNKKKDSGGLPSQSTPVFPFLFYTENIVKLAGRIWRRY